MLTLLLLGSPVGSAPMASPIEDPQWKLAVEGFTTSDVMPNSDDSGPDQAAFTRFEISSAARIASQLKLSFGLNTSLSRYQRVGIAGFEEYGGVLAVRRGSSQLVWEAGWTPARIKFQDDAGRAEFRRIESTVGLRQALPSGIRARAQWTYRRDDYVNVFNIRDASGPSWSARLDWRPQPIVTLRAELGGGSTTGRTARYSQDERWVSGGITVARGRWKLEPWLVSGTQRYPEAEATDSNFRRRDQWIETGIRAAVTVHPQLTLLIAGTLLDQTSSRHDRTYDVRSVRFGFEWFSPEN